MACTGDPNQICGGTSTNSVYLASTTNQCKSFYRILKFRILRHISNILVGLISGPTISGTVLTINSAKLISQGYTLVYNKPYSWPTTAAEILSIGDQCNSTSVICVAGADSTGTLLLAACGNCLAITTTTTLNSPVFVDGMWWYFTPGLDFI